MLPLFLSLLVLQLLATFPAATTPTTSFLSTHPFHTHPQFLSLPRSPTILSTYFRHPSPSTHTTNGVRYLPRFARYNHLHPTDAPLADQPLDALHVSPTLVASDKAHRNIDTETNPAPFLTVTLNAPATIVLLLALDRPASTRHDHQNDDDDNKHKVFGLPHPWTQHTNTTMAIPLVAAPSANHTIPQGPRLSKPITLPPNVYAVQTTIHPTQQNHTQANLNLTFTLPHPSHITVSGENVVRYVLLFAQPRNATTVTTEKLIAFPYQTTPPSVTDPVTGTQIADPEPPTPNETCPSWLHNLYTTPTPSHHDTHPDEPQHWHTWHPQIDPYYWCYFDHEHGTYPGPNYRPRFSYTPLKTPDNSTTTGSQIESHPGFKIHSFPLHDQRLFVVLTVHMHLSQLRRFTTRHHTLILAVLDQQENLLLELHMKADFGFAFASSNARNGKKRKPIPLTPLDASIQKELAARNFFAGRRFNILNVDDEYPSSVDKRFAFRNGLQPTVKNREQILLGVYEKWITPLNTCARSSKGLQKGFVIDVQNPSTGIKSFDEGSDQPMQMLNGSSEHRVIDILESSGDLEIGVKHCSFFNDSSHSIDLLKKNKGVFYTDPYFSTLHDGPGKFSMRQYISPDLGVVTLKTGRLNSIHGWSGHMEYETPEDTPEELESKQLTNPENAALPEVN